MTHHNLNDPEAIIKAIERPEGSVPLRVLEAAQLKDLIAAVSVAESLDARITLYVVLGNRADPDATPTLIGGLDDDERKVRSASADGLGKIAMQLRRRAKPVPDEIGEALMSRWQPTESSWFLSALGASQYSPAEPVLIASLEQGDWDARSAAAWGLGELGGEAARAALERAFANEQDSHARTQIAAAIERLK